MNLKELKTKARAYALKNAIAYNGKSQQGAVISALFNEGLKKDEVKKYVKNVSKIVGEVNKLSVEKQKKEFEKLEREISKRPAREGLPELPSVSEPRSGSPKTYPRRAREPLTRLDSGRKDKVVMRFAPSPSGAFHVGHALTSSISFLFVQKYGGKFYVRIEDTNPENIYKPAYDLIKKDSEWLFKKKAIIVIQSDRMEIYYKYAEKLIKKGHAYVCTCSGDDFRECVKLQQDCACRSLNPKENKERWEMMFNAESYKPGDAVLRFKSSMTHKNPAMRDFPLARINETPHPLQKKKYRVWPLMNLAVPVDDIEMKMTHIIRGKDHMDNAKRQKMIFDVLGKKFPWTGFLGRWHIKGLRLSASEITRGIKEGKYSGWDDPKLPTLQALKKKGYKPQAFWKFAEKIGLSENDKIIGKEEFFELLDTFNKQNI